MAQLLLAPRPHAVEHEAVPRIILDITDELASELLNRRVDAVAVCLTALREAVDKPPEKCITEAMTTLPNETKDEAPAPKRMGRPPGRTREKRTINLEPRIWAWLEARQLPDESFSDTCNRTLDEASKVLP